MTPRLYEECFVSFGVDGQYLQLNIMRHFQKQSLFPDETPWKKFEIWDPAHIMERAILDGFTKIPLLKKQTTIMQNVVKHVQFGKAYEELLESAKRMEIHLSKPKLFKSKKFVVDCEKVYRSFFGNYPAIVRTLQAQLPDSDAESYLRGITDERFLLSTTFLSGVCSVLAVYSSNFQKYDALVNDLVNCAESLVDNLNIINVAVSSDPPKITELPGSGFKLFHDAVQAVNKGEFKGVPLLGRTSLWSHYGTLVNQSIYNKFGEFTSKISDGFTKRISPVTTNNLIIAGQKFLNCLMGYVYPHTFKTDFNSHDLSVLLNVKEDQIAIIVKRFGSGLTKKAELTGSFQSALRLVLVDPDCYNSFSSEILHGIMRLLVLASSEAIAETHGSHIDNLHQRYCNTDPDDTRLQKELKVLLMGPPPCTQSGEQFVRRVAQKLTAQHSFINKRSGRGMDPGACVTNYVSKKYNQPWQF